MILKAMRGKVAPAAGGSLKTAPPPTEEKPPPLGLGEIKQMKKQRGADAFYGEALIRDKEIGENVETFNRDELAFENEPGKPDYCDSADFDSLSLGGGSCDEIEKGAEKDAYDFETGREEEVTDASEPATGETEHESGADEQEEDFSGITMTSSRDEF